MEIERITGHVIDYRPPRRSARLAEVGLFTRILSRAKNSYARADRGSRNVARQVRLQYRGQ